MADANKLAILRAKLRWGTREIDRQSFYAEEWPERIEREGVEFQRIPSTEATYSAALMQCDYVEIFDEEA